jgi:hypothetical protein
MGDGETVASRLFCVFAVCKAPEGREILREGRKGLLRALSQCFIPSEMLFVLQDSLRGKEKP